MQKENSLELKACYQKPGIHLPKVSVLMSVYNNEFYLDTAVKSILNQTFRDFEFIIIDDYSTDTSRDILYSYNDARIRLINNEKNIGLTKSLNKGLPFARGEYIARMDADDISLSDRVAIQVDFLDTHPDVGLLAGNIEIIDQNGKTTGYSKDDNHPDLIKWYSLFYNNFPAHSIAMFRTKLVRELGGYNEVIETAQDYDLWSRIAQQTNIVILPDILLKWRDHKLSISSLRWDEQQQSAQMIAYRNMENLMGLEWANKETYLEMIGFWRGRFLNCRRPLRLWNNLFRLGTEFMKKRELISSKQTFSAMLRETQSRQLFCWLNHSFNQQYYARAFICGILAAITSPLECFNKLKRRLTMMTH